MTAEGLPPDPRDADPSAADHPAADHDVTFGGWRGCDACGESITMVEEAALVLRAALLAERQGAVAEATEAGNDIAAIGLVPWDWGHRACFSGFDLTYAIDGTKMDTLPRLMARTLQLLDEDWFLETAWEDAVRRFYRVPFD
ncbi:MAG: hypothetical protein WD734_06690 [Dehalococcoidia bacterium]